LHVIHCHATALGIIEPGVAQLRHALVRSVPRLEVENRGPVITV
jgi:hypothetical protein